MRDPFRLDAWQRSVPEAMDKLDRRLIQLKIEREAVKKETDEPSRKRLGLIEEEIRKLERQYADADELLRTEKAAVQGSAHIKAETATRSRDPPSTTR